MSVEQPPVMAHQNETQDQAHPVHAEIERPPDLPPAPAGRAKIMVGIALLILLVAGLVTFLSRKSETDALAKETDADAVPTVAVVQPKPVTGDNELVLPGNLQAYIESPIFARTNGYLLRWYKDIGSKVEKGELLASIDTPEVDQELSQARATREQINAALGLAKISADRWANLRKSDSVSQQEADQQASGYVQAQANLAAADANVRRLEEMESFKNVYAPFSGVLTRRNVDPGALINSGAQANGRELVRCCARRSAARLRASAAGLCAVDESWRQSGCHIAGISGAEIYRHDCTNRRFDRYGYTHTEHRSGCAQ